jgi:hypothetical protein
LQKNGQRPSHQTLTTYPGYEELKGSFMRTIREYQFQKVEAPSKATKMEPLQSGRE